MGLARFLAQYRDKYYRWKLPDLSADEILSWADAHFARHGRWPSRDSGAIPMFPGESWQTVDSALRTGRRGVRGRRTLTRFLAAHGRVNPALLKSMLTVDQIVKWAQRHYQKTGSWPNTLSGAVQGARGETWQNIDLALRSGYRGHTGGSSLRELLATEAGAAIHGRHAPLTIRQIRSWAKAYCRRTGTRPSKSSGAIAEAPGENWCAIHQALRNGFRGLPGGITLARLLSDLPRPPKHASTPGLHGDSTSIHDPPLAPGIVAAARIRFATIPQTVPNAHFIAQLAK
jgi:hypothetical protein